MIETENDQVAHDLPVACSLSDRDQARRRDEITHSLFNERQETRPLQDGYALRFPSDESWALRLLAFIAGERACCPFFTFELLFEPRQGPIWLHLRGPAGTKELVASLLTPVAGDGDRATTTG